jgi:hypothetical protein
MKQGLTRGTVHTARDISTYRYQCVSGPDLLRVRVEDGVAACNQGFALAHSRARGAAGNLR